jgi:hypothetical protein
MALPRVLPLPLSQAGGTNSQALVASTAIMVQSSAAAVGVAALSIKTALQLKASDALAGKISLLGATALQVKASDAIRGSIGILAARTAIKVKALGQFSTSAFVQLAGSRIVTQIKASAAITNALALSSKIRMQVKAPIGPSLRVIGLSAKTKFQTTVRASITTGAASVTRIWAYLFND